MIPESETVLVEHNRLYLFASFRLAGADDTSEFCQRLKRETKGDLRRRFRAEPDEQATEVSEDEPRGNESSAKDDRELAWMSCHENAPPPRGRSDPAAIPVPMDSSLEARVGAASETSAAGASMQPAGDMPEAEGAPRRAPEHGKKAVSKSWALSDREFHPDLYRVVRRILHARTGDLSDVDDTFVPPYRLASGIVPRNWVTKMSEGAQRRLADSAPEFAKAGVFAFTLRDVRLFVFGTGVGIFCYEIEVVSPFTKAGGVCSELLIEVVTALSGRRVIDQPWKPAKFLHPRALEPIRCQDWVVMVKDGRVGVRRASGTDASLERIRALADAALDTHVPVCEYSAHRTVDSFDLAVRLVPRCVCGTCAVLVDREEVPQAPTEERRCLGVPVLTDESRLFSYTAASLHTSASKECSDVVAYRLAHRFTREYQIESSWLQGACVRPFHNICHSMAMQGGAALIVPNASEFDRSFLNDAVPRTYLPLCIFARHEYLKLRHWSHAELFSKMERKPEERERWVRRLMAELSDFVLRYRFSYVSDLTHHNLVYLKWRKTLALDETLAELSLDAAEGKREVDAQLEQEAKKHRMLFATLGCLALLPLFRGVMEFVRDALFVHPSDLAQHFLKVTTAMIEPNTMKEQERALLIHRMQEMVQKYESWESCEWWVFVIGALLVLVGVGYVFAFKRSPMSLEIGEE